MRAVMQRLWSWLAGDAPAGGSSSIPSAERMIDEILAVPARAKRIRTAGAYLADLDHDVVEGIVRAFAAYVIDIPASEKHHHSEKYGLLDHSLEVAEYALRAAETERFVDSTDAKPEEQEHRLPRLRFGAWYWGLLHDAGKVTQVYVHGPRRELWNPFREPLAEFYTRHGRDRCAHSWKYRRGMDAHTWETAYLLGRLLPAAVADYLGLRITSELVEQETPAARRVFKLIEDADHRSTREALARQAALRASTPATAQAALFVPTADLIERVPDAVARAIAEGTIRLNGDVATSEAFLGGKYLLLRYPQALQKIAILLRETAGRECAAARALDGSEEGARSLAGALHERRRIFYDRETDTWKLKAKLAAEGAFDVLSAVLLPRAFVDPSLRTLGDFSQSLFTGDATFARASDGAPVKVDDFHRRLQVPPPAPVVPPAAVVPPATVLPTAAPPAAAPIAPASQAAAAPVPTLRKFISGEQLVEDLRGAILSGAIPTNVWNGQAYVLPDVTYLISPRVFGCLVKLGLYSRDPGTELNAYLDAMAKVPCVRKGAGGKVQLSIQLRPGARPAWAVALDTRGFFPDARTLAAVGQWSATAIRELSEAELRAVQEDLRRRKDPAVIAPAAAAPPTPPTTVVGVAHA